MAELDVRMMELGNINSEYGLVFRGGGDYGVYVYIGGFGCGVQIPFCFSLYMNECVIGHQRNVFIERFVVSSEDTVPICN